MKKPFIVFEGVDGAGKSKVSYKVSEYFNAKHLESPIGKFREIRSYVDENLNDHARFMFYMASNIDLSQYIQNKRNEFIVCARYYHSTIIGYASRQRLNITEFYNTDFCQLNFEEPDLTFFLFVNEDTQCNRIALRNNNQNTITDNMCLHDENYRKILIQNYCLVAKKEKWIYVDTSSLSLDEVVNFCIQKISQYHLYTI